MKAAAQGKSKPGKIGPATSRSIYPRPPLRDSTQVISDSKPKAKPSEGTPQGPVDRGFAADYFGASPVASALDLRSGATPCGSTSRYDKEENVHALGYFLT